MNFSAIVYILGWVIRLEGLFMLLPVLVAFFYKEEAGISFFFCALFCHIVGWLITRRKIRNHAFYAKEGFVTVSASWLVLGIMGSLPFYFSGEFPSYIDSLFEIISGFTTTGASILSDVEALSRCTLIWRSFSHWIGGMGVLVFILAILPMAGGADAMSLMRAESPGPSVGKLVPRIQKTAGMLYGIYLFLTLLQIVLLLCFGMPFFDAVCTAMGTAGTGGFGIKNASLAAYGTAIQNITTVFMFLFGMNFNFYFLLFIHKSKDAFRMEEVRWYLGIFVAAILAITLNLTLESSFSFFTSLHHAAFQVSSIMTTTGFSTFDFNAWPQFSRSVLVVLMFIGACAGSTGGGIKVSRILIYLKTVKKELAQVIHPRNIKILKLEGKAIKHDVVRSANTFLIAYFVLFTFSFLAISLNEFDLTTSFTAVAATFNNIGPGLELVGPTGNFSHFSIFSKLVLIFDMLAGRLEVFPMLVLFAPSTWRKGC